MKKLLFLLICLLFLSSCVTIEFENPQPKKAKSLTEFPEELRGKYIVKIIDESSEPSEDTLIIANNHYYESLVKDNKKMFLSDSCILNTLESDYLINFKTKSDINWTVGLMRLQSNKNIMIYGLFEADENEERLISEINSITAVQRTTKHNEEKVYTINPSKKELKQIIDRGYFKPVYELIKIKE